MTQKRRKADSGKAIGEMTALRWEPTHVTKPNPRVVPLQIPAWQPKRRSLHNPLQSPGYTPLPQYVPFASLLFHLYSI